MHNKYSITSLLFMMVVVSVFAQKIESDTSEVLNINESSDIIVPALIPTNAGSYSGAFNSYFTDDSTISAQEVDASTSGDASRIMQSKTAGLSVSANSYTPGASSRIIMRGYRSINGNNQALILLNGMPVDNSEWNNALGGTDQSNRLLDIDPNFIESIDVIKSAAGRAKYGIVGANGVIHIKTKKGYQSKPRITFKSTIGIDQVSKMPARQSTYAQGRSLNGIQEYRGPETGEGSSWGPAISDLEYDGQQENPYDQNGAIVNRGEGNGGAVNAYNPYDFLDKGTHINYSLNVAGGNERINYFLSGSVNNQTGIIPTNEFNRYNLSTVLDFDLTKKLSFEVNALLSAGNAQRSQTGSNLNSIMFGLTRTTPTFDIANGLSDPLNDPMSYELEDGTQRSYRHGIYDNPYWSLNKNKHTDRVARQMIKISGQFDLSESLDLLLNAGTDQYEDKRLGGFDIDPSPFNPTTGSAYERNLAFDAQFVDFSVRHTIKKGELLNITSTIGVNYYQHEKAYQITEASDLLTSNNVSIINTAELESLDRLSQSKRAGGILSVDASFKDYLNITGSLKQDYSNKFGENTNGFLSYGLGAGLSVPSMLAVGNTNATKSFDVLILASMGRLGNDYTGQDVPTFLQAEISGDGLITGTNLDEYEPNSVFVSNELTAETTTAFDVGLSFIMNKNNLNLSVDYYNEATSGLIMLNGLAASAGYTLIKHNIGEMTNKGFDVSLSIDPIRKEKFSWTSMVSFNKNKNLISKMDELGLIEELPLSGFTSTSSSIVLGHSYGMIYGNGFQRNDEGLVLIAEDGFPLVDPERQVIGDPNPDWTMYINNSFQIGKNFTLHASIDIKKGGDMWCGTCGVMDYFGTSQLSADERGEVLVFEGVTESGAVNNQPVELATATGSFNEFYRVRYGFGGNTEMSVHDASWLRLRNISIGYDFSQLLGVKLLRDLSLSFYAENFFILTKYPGIDPETNLQGNAGGIGLDYFNNPGTKRYGLSLQASF